MEAAEAVILVGLNIVAPLPDLRVPYRGIFSVTIPLC